MALFGKKQTPPVQQDKDSVQQKPAAEPFIPLWRREMMRERGQPYQSDLKVEDYEQLNQSILPEKKQQPVRLGVSVESFTDGKPNTTKSSISNALNADSAKYDSGVAEQRAEEERLEFVRNLLGSDHESKDGSRIA